MIGFGFIVFGEAALKAEPSECALDEAAFELNHECVAGEIGALDDFQSR